MRPPRASPIKAILFHGSCYHLLWILGHHYLSGRTHSLDFAISVISSISTRLDETRDLNVEEVDEVCFLVEPNLVSYFYSYFSSYRYLFVVVVAVVVVGVYHLRPWTLRLYATASRPVSIPLQSCLTISIRVLLFLVRHLRPEIFFLESSTLLPPSIGRYPSRPCFFATVRSDLPILSRCGDDHRRRSEKFSIPTFGYRRHNASKYQEPFQLGRV